MGGGLSILLIPTLHDKNTSFFYKHSGTKKNTNPQNPPILFGDIFLFFDRQVSCPTVSEQVTTMLVDRKNGLSGNFLLLGFKTPTKDKAWEQRCILGGR